MPVSPDTFTPNSNLINHGLCYTGMVEGVSLVSVRGKSQPMFRLTHPRQVDCANNIGWDFSIPNRRAADGFQPKAAALSIEVPMPDKSLSSSQLSATDRREYARELVSQAIGTDKLWYLVNGIFVRQSSVDNLKHYSIIDGITIFAKTNTPDMRRYWSDRKRAIIGSNSELYEKIVQLKLPSPDGKMRSSDVSPLWGLLSIISKLDTPASNDLMNAIFKGVATAVDNAILKYHAGNIERGYEWSANLNHQTMLDAGAYSDPDLQRPDRWSDIVGGGR
jgi:hypothetical protein